MQVFSDPTGSKDVKPVAIIVIIFVQSVFWNYPLNGPLHLAGYEFNSDSDMDTDKAVLFYHRITEAFKFAFARRSELGDKEFTAIQNVSWVYHFLFNSNQKQILQTKVICCN